MCLKLIYDPENKHQSFIYFDTSYFLLLWSFYFHAEMIFLVK